MVYWDIHNGLLRCVVFTDKTYWHDVHSNNRDVCCLSVGFSCSGCGWPSGGWKGTHEYTVVAVYTSSPSVFDIADWWQWTIIYGEQALKYLLLVYCYYYYWEWRYFKQICLYSSGSDSGACRGGPIRTLPGYFWTLYIMICLNVLRARMYTVSVEVTRHMAMDYGGVESTSRASGHEASTLKPEYLVVFCV